jgi:hypothetical protein
MTKDRVTRAVVIAVDRLTLRDHFEIFDPPISGIAPHFGKSLRRIGHRVMVSPVIPHSQSRWPGGDDQ